MTDLAPDYARTTYASCRSSAYSRCWKRCGARAVRRFQAEACATVIVSFLVVLLHDPDIEHSQTRGDATMRHFTIAIVGAGFSGTLLALHLMHRCPPCTHVLLIERNSQFGRGPAYETSNPSHLLNVPAGRMSAYQSRPNDFIDWLHRLSPDELVGFRRQGRSFPATSSAATSVIC